MVHYEGEVYRPPCEARSLIIQATLGCPWNRCAFCGMYKAQKYRVRPLEEVLEDFESARAIYRHVPSVFLADGNTISLPTEDLLTLLHRAHDIFPELEHVGVYGGTRFINQKPTEDLAALREAGLSIVYLGLESGDDETLRRMKKGVTAAEAVAAGRRLKQAGFPVSVYVLVGLGGAERYLEHARGTAVAINAMEPDIVRPRTLYIQEGTPLWHQRARGEFVEAGPREALLELRELIAGIDAPVTFLSDHITNYLRLNGRLPADRDELVTAIDKTLAGADLSSLRPEHFAHL